MQRRFADKAGAVGANLPGMTRSRSAAGEMLGLYDHQAARFEERPRRQAFKTEQEEVRARDVLRDEVVWERESSTRHHLSVGRHDGSREDQIAIRVFSQEEKAAVGSGRAEAQNAHLPGGE